MRLEKIIRKTQKELKSYTAGILRSMRYEVFVRDGFVYAKGTQPVLLVAHLDTVHKHPVQLIMYTKKGDYMMSPQGIGGDDRCGVYMALKLAEETGCHVLFCEDEEIGGIGATKFVNSGIKPDVNYIIEFDRRGSNDAVFYDCANDDFVDFVESFGFSTTFGSFSDISIIAPALGVAAVNLSCGYYNAHSENEYININEMENNIQRANAMVVSEVNKFEYVEKLKYANSFLTSYYWPKKDNFSDFIALKNLPERTFPVVEGVRKEQSGILMIGEDDRCYQFIEEFDVVIYFGECVVDGNNSPVWFDKLPEQEDYYEEVSAFELYDMYYEQA
jgi:hypothetical protein